MPLRTLMRVLFPKPFLQRWRKLAVTHGKEQGSSAIVSPKVRRMSVASSSGCAVAARCSSTRANPSRPARSYAHAHVRFTPVKGDKTAIRKPRNICWAAWSSPKTDQERAELGHDETARDGAAIASAPTGERRSADNDRRDRGQQIGRADCRIGCAAEIRRAECQSRPQETR